MQACACVYTDTHTHTHIPMFSILYNMAEMLVLFMPWCSQCKNWTQLEPLLQAYQAVGLTALVLQSF